MQMNIPRIMSDELDADRIFSRSASEGPEEYESFRRSLIFIELSRIFETCFAAVVERRKACRIWEQYRMTWCVGKFRERFVIFLKRSDSFAECSHVTCGGDLIVGIGGMIIEYKRARKDLRSRARSPDSTSKDNVGPNKHEKETR